MGSTVACHADVRLVSATNTDLQEAIAKKTFREDLYFRLNVVELRVPPLGRRPDDVLAIAEELLRTHGEGTTATFDAGAREALAGHSWPGNVRELQNRIQRAVIVARGGTITREALDLGANDLTARRGEAVRLDRDPVALPTP